MANDNQKRSAKLLGQQFEQAVLDFYECGAIGGELRAFDVNSGIGVLTVIWTIVLREDADKIKKLLDRAVN